jgi:hypothetical protein
MSGEASWIASGERYGLVILSGRAVWTAAEGSSIAEALKARFGAQLPAIARAIDARAEAMRLQKLETNAPPIRDALTDDAHAGRPLSSGATRTTIFVNLRHKPTNEGFNLTLTVGVRVSRAQVEALAVELARLLWPDYQPELPIRIQ